MVIKGLYVTAGCSFVVLAAIGVALPGLPTVPFLLLAAGCFAKSSPRFHGWLLNSRLFGPLISNWQQTRTIARKSKYLAIGSMLLMGGGSLFLLADKAYLQALMIALLLIGAFVVARIPETESLAKEYVKE